VLECSLRSALELEPITGYDDAMSRLTWLFSFLLVSLGVLTGCAMWNRNYNRIRAELTKPEADEDVHNYGAYFAAPFPATTETSPTGAPSAAPGRNAK
jgi:hypothetical protein